MEIVEYVEGGIGIAFLKTIALVFVCEINAKPTK